MHMMQQKLKQYEKKYILQSSHAAESDDEVEHDFEVGSMMARGSYLELLKSSAAQSVFSSHGERTSALSCHMTDALNQQQPDEQRHVVLCVGAACLQLFVQSNFTGPAKLVPDFLEVFPCLVKDGETQEERRKSVLECIAEDTEGIYTLIRNPEYLLVAKCAFKSFDNCVDTCLTIDWWRLRYDVILQTIADETSSQIYERVSQYIIDLDSCEILKKDEELRAQYHLEAGQAFLLFADIGSSSTQFNRAESVLKLKSNLSGALGKRTKYQIDPKAQLVVQVQYENKTILAGEAESSRLLQSDLPKDVLLNDDTRLPHIKFLEEDEDKVPSLRPVEQMILLTKVQQKRRSCAADLQLKEETKAYLSALLQYPKCWVIQYNALRLRSLLESEESRAVDRALMQLEELVECFDREEPSRFERLKLFYTSGLPSFWSTKQEYGKLLVQMGCTKTALGIFEELQLWEDVIDCYNRIGMRQRSAVILKDLLKEDESPKLLCLLGDATDDIECYNRAWTVSHDRSSRAQRSLGDYYFARKDYDTAIEHYQMSIKVNHLQIKVWQNIAFAALKLDDWDLCCSSYKKCTTLEPDYYEFWNNLAKAHVQLKDMSKAWKCLQEAVRCKSDSWKMFENLMTVGTSLGHFADALFAYNRLLVLKPRHINLLVISAMVGSLIDGECKDDFGVHFHKQLVSFLGKLCQSCPSDSDLWYYYGEAVSSNPSPTVESRDLACQHFRKALATATRDGSWYKNQDRIEKALTKMLRMEKSLVVSVDGVAPQTALVNVRSVAMMSENVMVLAQKGLTNVATGEIVASAVDILTDAQAAQMRIKQLVNQLVADSTQS